MSPASPTPPAGADAIALLERARELAALVLAPAANTTDQADSVPREHLRALAGAGLLGIATPARYGGVGAPARVAREVLEILAGACGVTAFVQMQHATAACPLIARGDNEALKERVLPRLASGRTASTTPRSASSARRCSTRSRPRHAICRRRRCSGCSAGAPARWTARVREGRGRAAPYAGPWGAARSSPRSAPPSAYAPTNSRSFRVW
ncbi:acyl-CoA dehydrogenase family protein [Sorangium sp. So ce542]|uniref:acyl-CoA dehydrogenase family protein n=1 Tax=Sorangium sp. So ce542 TaxID=3133316 RepID=UPI003F5FF691